MLQGSYAFGFVAFAQNVPPPTVPTGPVAPDPSSFQMPALGDMNGLIQLQSQMAAQSAQMLNQMYQMLADNKPTPFTLPTSPMCPPGGYSLQGYCCPQLPESSWPQSLPWNDGGCPQAPPYQRPLTHHRPHGCHPHPDGTAPSHVNSSSLASCSPRTRAFIESALAKQGKPYVFGATGPSAFDCSGLVYRSLKEAGVQGPRMAARYMQADLKNHAVSKQDLKPGDLLFFWSPNDRGIPYPKASHVEIYLGDGKSMGTDNPKEGARVESVNWATFVGGARVPELQA